MNIELAIILVIFSPLGVFAEDISIPARHPSPLGIYNEITTTGQTVFARDGGALGIGTNSPLDILHIRSAGPSLRLEDSTGQGFDIRVSGAKKWSIFDPQAGVGGTERMAVDALGHVGIGTAPDPVAAVAIFGDPALSMPNPGGYAREISFQPSDDPSTVDWEVGSHGQTIRFFGNIETLATTSWPTDLYIYKDGSVIIGPIWADSMALPCVSCGVDAPRGPIQLYPDNIHAGAYLSNTGQWMCTSSLAAKTDIKTLDEKAALETFRALEPVAFHYKVMPHESNVGFIAEDVPELMAHGERKSLSPMDFAALLTKIAKKHEQDIEDISRRLKKIEAR